MAGFFGLFMAFTIGLGLFLAAFEILRWRTGQVRYLRLIGMWGAAFGLSLAIALAAAIVLYPGADTSHTHAMMGHGDPRTAWQALLGSGLSAAFVVAAVGALHLLWHEFLAESRAMVALGLGGAAVLAGAGVLAFGASLPTLGALAVAGAGVVLMRGGRLFGLRPALAVVVACAPLGFFSLPDGWMADGAVLPGTGMLAGLLALAAMGLAATVKVLLAGPVGAVARPAPAPPAPRPSPPPRPTVPRRG